MEDLLKRIYTTKQLEYYTFHVKQYIKDYEQSQREKKIDKQFTHPSIPSDVEELVKTKGDDLYKASLSILDGLNDMLKDIEINYVTFAQLPTEEFSIDLAVKLREALGKENVIFSFLQNRDIYGGFLLRTKSKILDRSFKSVFENHKGELIKIIQSL